MKSNCEQHTTARVITPHIPTTKGRNSMIKTLMLSTIFALGTCAMAASAQAADATMDHGKMDHGKMDHSKMDHSKMDHAATPGATEAAGVGVINAIDATKNQVNVTHEPMPDLGWPTMTMDLPVTSAVDLGTIKPGDKVSFRVKLGRDKTYRIMEISPTK